MLLVAPFEQPERLVFVAESRVNSRAAIEIDIGVRGQVLELFARSLVHQPACPTRHKPNLDTQLRTGSLLLTTLSCIGNFVVLGKGLRIHVLHCVCPTRVPHVLLEGLD